MEATNDNQPNAEVDAGSEPDWEARTDSDTNAGSETDTKKFIEDTPKGDACTETAVDGDEETITSPHRLTLRKISMLD